MCCSHFQLLPTTVIIEPHRLSQNTYNTHGVDRVQCPLTLKTEERLTPPKVRRHPHTRPARQLRRGVEHRLTTRKKTEGTKKIRKDTVQPVKATMPRKDSQLNITTNKGDHSGEN